MIIDSESEPGSWKRELDRMPWGYGQTQSMKLETALANLRGRGLYKEATIIEQEIRTLKAELEHIRKQDGR